MGEEQLWELASKVSEGTTGRGGGHPSFGEEGLLFTVTWPTRGRCPPKLPLPNAGVHDPQPGLQTLSRLVGGYKPYLRLACFSFYINGTIYSVSFLTQHHVFNIDP